MDIKDIIEEKRILEKKIRDMLLEFSNKTSLCVDGVRFEMDKEYNGKFSCTAVRVNLIIDDY